MWHDVRLQYAPIVTDTGTGSLTDNTGTKNEILTPRHPQKDQDQVGYSINKSDLIDIEKNYQ